MALAKMIMSLILSSSPAASSSPASSSVSSSASKVAMEVRLPRSRPPPHVLTVAGSDSAAGAGIQADIKACAALGVFCSTAITAITAQNTRGVQGIHVVPEDIFSMQLESVFSDMQVDVVKTGMLPTPQIVSALCHKLRAHPVQGIVVDPVMVSTSGNTLAGREILEALCKDLLPMVDIVTPNLPEASILSGRGTIDTVSGMHEAAKAIKAYGPRYVLIKGGHLPGSDDVVDVLYDGQTFHALHGRRVETRNTHGTGCTLASSIAAEMAKGAHILKAVQTAKNYVAEALEKSKSLELGKGDNGPLNHMFKFNDWSKQTEAQPHFKPTDLFLYAITDSGMNKRWQRSMYEAVEAAIKGGATMVQLREKELEANVFVEEAISCVAFARKRGVPIVINDRLDIAMACDADGVHLGQQDIPVTRARAILGPHKIIGASCKTVEQAQRAFQDGADYIGCGGVYPTTTKQNNPTLGIQGLHVVCEGSPLPVVAIGGINASNAKDVFVPRPPKLCGVAVVSALFDRADVMAEASQLAKMLSEI